MGATQVDTAWQYATTRTASAVKTVEGTCYCCVYPQTGWMERIVDW